MKIFLGSDHGGFIQKNKAKEFLINEGFDVVDLGTDSIVSCDYPIYAKKVAEETVKNEGSFGILFCTSGEGMIIVANKIKGCRAGLGYNDQVTSALRRHNNANVIAFGSKYMTDDEVFNRIKIFISTNFEGGRHEKRVNLIKDLEK